MIPPRKIMIIDEIRSKKQNKLTFVHTPKCGGSYVNKILQDLNITSIGHNQAIINNGINFTVIRHPVERFESLLNYRLGETTPRSDWPSHLNHVYKDSKIDLNTIVEKMTDREITGFRPYTTLTHWGKNVDIFLLIDELQDFLEMNGYVYDIDKYNKVNVSPKRRGKLNDANKERISKLYEDDMALFAKWSYDK